MREREYALGEEVNDSEAARRRPAPGPAPGAPTAA